MAEYSCDTVCTRNTTEIDMADCNSTQSLIEIGMELSTHEESEPMDATLYRKPERSPIYLSPKLFIGRQTKES